MIYFSTPFPINHTLLTETEIGYAVLSMMPTFYIRIVTHIKYERSVHQSC